jgi:hypothetical protein
VTLPTTDTIVTYPAGDTTSESRVIHVESLEHHLAVLLDRTAVRQHAEAVHGLARMVDEYERLFEDVLAAERAA